MESRLIVAGLKSCKNTECNWNCTDDGYLGCRKVVPYVTLCPDITRGNFQGCNNSKCVYWRLGYLFGCSKDNVLAALVCKSVVF